MGRYFEGNEENITALKKSHDDRMATAEYTGIKAIDDIFGYLVVGSTYMISATTGVGKSSFLLATAKKLAEKKKVLYITIEQSMDQLSQVIDANTNLDYYEMEYWKDWKEVVEINNNKHYDYVVFDYLGADCVEDWDELINKSGELAAMAKANNWIIFTACQAKPELTQQFKEDRFNLKLFTSMYIAYSKGMAAKIAGGVYLIKNSENTFYLYNFKNRYSPISNVPYAVNNLNLEKKIFEEK